MSFVDDDRIAMASDGFDLAPFTGAVQVRVVQNEHVLPRSSADMAEKPLQVRLPDGLTARLRDDQGDPLPVMAGEPLQQHQADESFAEADAIAQERSAVVPSDLQQLAVAFALVAVEQGIDDRLRLIPLVRGDLAATKILVERLGIDLKRGERLDVPLDDLQDVESDVLGLVPMLLVPLLKNGDRLPGDLNVKLHVLSKTRAREVR